MRPALHLMTLASALALLVACGEGKDGADKGTIGSPCTQDGDCEDGLTCYLGVEGGYCSMDCSSATCPEGTECMTSLGTDLCMPVCTTSAECGEDMACVGGGCVPACASDDDCGGEGSGHVCENGGCVTPTLVRGEVFDSETLDPIEGARVVIIDGDTMAAAAPVAITDAGGMFSQRVVLREDQESMGFTLRVAAEGYMPFPDPPVRPAIPEQVVRFTSSDVVPVALIHDPALEGLGSIAGTVTLDGTGVGGVLVVASGGAEDLSTVTDVDGTYVLLNMPDGTWDLFALAAGMTRGEAPDVAVASGADVTGVDMALAIDPAGSVSGTCNFVAGGTPPASVVLFYPGTTEAVPGLRVITDGDWIIEDVPDGDYDIYATYDNDCNVQDPDAQLAHTAIQRVTVAGAPVVVETTFNITDAVAMTGVWADEPCEHDDNSIRVVSYGVDETPVFTWTDYPGSTQGYCVEVVDVFGTVVWGGFDTDGTPFTCFANHTIEAAYDGDPLEGGLSYHFTIWARANDSGAPLGFRWISSSENLRGLFEIRSPIE